MNMNTSIFYFLYGLTFFSMGFAIFSRIRPIINTEIARTFGWLALFGMLHSIHEWIRMFVAMGHAHDSIALSAVGLFFVTASFTALLKFATCLIRIDSNGGKEPAAMKRIFPAVILLFWSFFLIATIARGNNIAAVEQLTRYLIGVPGAFLAACAFIISGRKFAEKSFFSKSFILAGVSFGVYGALTAIIPEMSFHTASHFSHWRQGASFLYPLQTLMGLVSIAIAVFVVMALDVIDTVEKKSLVSRVSETSRDLEDSESRYRTLVENVSDMIFLLDPNGNVIFANSFVERHFGFRMCDLKGIPLCFFWCGDSARHVDEAIDAVKSSFRDVSLVSECLDEYHELKISPIVHGEGISGMICVARDITERIREKAEREQLQQQLFHSQKMDAIGKLAGGMAHDFNNLLTVITGNADLAMARLDETAAGFLEFEQILKASERARDMTMRLLTFARKDKLNVRPAGMSEILGELKSMLDRCLPKNISISIVFKDDIRVSVDSTQIQQALLNVCTNARDAMPEGGKLLMECRKAVVEKPLSENMDELKPGDYCLLRISDTGSGMPEDIVQKAFDPFFTTKPSGKGTGLGLSVTFGIIKNHGGAIRIHSEPERGTTVEILLPAVENAPSVQKEITTERAISKNNETILIVDDEKPVLHLTERMLTSCGYSVIAADSGRAAVELYKDSCGINGIDLVILDMLMPEMDGGDVFMAIREINPDVKAILMSGFSGDGMAEKLLGEGVRYFIQKPFIMKTLCSVVRTVLDGKISGYPEERLSPVVSGGV